MIRRRRSALIILTFAILLTWKSVAANEPASWRDDVLCGSKFSVQQESTIEDCLRANCVSATQALRICRCLKSEESGQALMLIEKDGKVVKQWDASFVPPASLADFVVYAVDLTGDGKEEFIVATLDAVSNGMGISYWQIRAIVGDSVSKQVPIEDFGVMGYPTRAKASKPCMLLSTRWLDGWEAERGLGLYLYGRWFAYSKSSKEFCPVLERPAVYRRYLYSFERLRMNELSKGQPDPILWFRDQRTKQLIGPYPEYERKWQ